MVDKVVLLVVEELVHLYEIGLVVNLVIRLRSMVSMAVSVLNIVQRVSHVLTVIDLVELSVSVSDFE